MLQIKHILPHLCNALIVDLSPDGVINSHQEVIFIHNSTIYVEREYCTSVQEYINPLNILGFNDCDMIADGGIIRINWDSHIFGVMTANTYNLYYRRV